MLDNIFYQTAQSNDNKIKAYFKKKQTNNVCTIMHVPGILKCIEIHCFKQRKGPQSLMSIRNSTLRFIFAYQKDHHGINKSHKWQKKVAL